VLLFDEPLSNLDLALREATRAEMKSLQRELGTTSLYVTHDQQEALALSDHIAILRSGRIVAEGAPELLYAEPPTAYVARFLGGANIISDGALAETLTGARPPDGHVLTVRPEALEQAAPDSPGSVAVRVLSRQFLGVSAEWHVEADGQPLRLWLPPNVDLAANPTLCTSSFRWVLDDAPPETPEDS
jgi:ABC-type Fe3+/spermidine/putrescine transport system ATPase subunit